MVTEIPRPVEKMGGSWVVKLDGGTRKLLGGVTDGSVVMVRKRGKEDERPETGKEDITTLE